MAATCSKIGGVNQVNQNEQQPDGHQNQNNAVAQAIQSGQIRVVSAAVLQQLQEQQNRNQAQGQTQVNLWQFCTYVILYNLRKVITIEIYISATGNYPVPAAEFLPSNSTASFNIYRDFTRCESSGSHFGKFKSVACSCLCTGIARTTLPGW